jgi:hypothetical protein
MLAKDRCCQKAQDTVRYASHSQTGEPKDRRKLKDEMLATHRNCPRIDVVRKLKTQ